MLEAAGGKESTEKRLKILNYKEKTMSNLHYKGCSVNISRSDIGMLPFSWVQLQDGSSTLFKMCAIIMFVLSHITAFR